MKKFVTFVLVLSLGLFAAIGCSPSTPKAKPKPPAVTKEEPKAEPSKEEPKAEPPADTAKEEPKADMPMPTDEKK